MRHFVWAKSVKTTYVCYATVAVKAHEEQVVCQEKFMNQEVADSVQAWEYQRS